MTCARIPRAFALLLLLATLAACAGSGEPGQRTVRDFDAEFEGPIDVIDANDLGDIMLAVADPQTSVAYFRQAVSRNPGRVDLMRGHARALARAGRTAEARLAFRDLDDRGALGTEDRVDYAAVLARLGRWEEAERAARPIPRGHATVRWAQLRGVLADHRGDWAAADAAYAQARELTVQPAPIYNNWGVSRMARGDLPGAEAAFARALIFDPDLFSAKNNLALSHGLRRDYRLPVVGMTETERAVMLHNLALLALRQGDVDVARGLFARAVESHPRHFPEAADKLATLSGAVRG